MFSSNILIINLVINMFYALPRKIACRTIIIGPRNLGENQLQRKYVNWCGLRMRLYFTILLYVVSSSYSMLELQASLLVMPKRWQSYAYGRRGATAFAANRRVRREQMRQIRGGLFAAHTAERTCVVARVGVMWRMRDVAVFFMGHAYFKKPANF